MRTAPLVSRWIERLLAAHDPPLTVAQYLTLQAIPGRNPALDGVSGSSGHPLLLTCRTGRGVCFGFPAGETGGAAVVADPEPVRFEGCRSPGRRCTGKSTGN